MSFSAQKGGKKNWHDNQISISLTHLKASQPINPPAGLCDKAGGSHCGTGGLSLVDSGTAQVHNLKLIRNKKKDLDLQLPEQRKS